MEGKKEIQERAPEVYTALLKTSSIVNWESIHEDLDLLNWLSLEASNESEIVKAAFKVIDLWAVSVLDDNPREKVFKINKVKFFVTGITSKLSSNKTLVTEICNKCWSQIN